MYSHWLHILKLKVILKVKYNNIVLSPSGTFLKLNTFKTKTKTKYTANIH